MLDKEVQLGIEYIVKDVLESQIEHLFLKMDELEDTHGHWAEMPISCFREHHRLGTTAARLGICRDRILRRIKTMGEQERGEVA